MHLQNLKPLGDGCHFFVAVQICAVIAALATTTQLALFFHHLTGFTLLLQGAAVITAVCYLGWQRHPYPLRRRARQTAVWGSVALASLAFYVGTLAVYAPYLPGGTNDLPVVAQLATAALIVGCALYVVHLYARNKQLLRDREELHISLSVKQLRHHFLFNALNTTAYLIKPQPESAIRILNDLSELFRVMLQQKAMSTLSEETEFTRRYIRIERRRLGARLGVKWQLPDYELMCTAMPSMVMQPLVENAIYHGIETREQGGVIKIIIQAQQNRVCFDIRNPIGDAQRIHRRKGNRVAQKSVRDRLLQTYGAACRYHCQRHHDEYRVTFSILQGEY